MQQQMQQQRFQLGAPTHSGWQTQHSQRFGDDVLVISDMQPHFNKAFRPGLVENICRLIDHAKAHNWVIIVLEFVGYGETLEPIRQRLAGYGNFYTVPKHAEDGSSAVLAKLKALQLSPKHYCACGVSVNVCVRLTVSSLAFSCGHPLVDVIQDACGEEHAPRWDEYPEASHLSLIPSLGH